MYSLKSRLIFAVVGLTLLVYALSAIGLYEYLEYKEHNNLLVDLKQDLELVTGLLEVEDEGRRIELELDQMKTGRLVDLYSGHYYIVRVAGQAPILSLSLGEKMPAFADSLQAQRQQHSFEAIGPQQEKLVVMSQSLSLAGREIQVIVAESQVQMQRWLSDIRLALLLGLPILLGVLLLLVGFVIGLALKPLEKLIAEIESFDFHQQTELSLPVRRPVIELQKLSLAFNQLLERFQKIRLAETQLLMDVSHQLKTPLTIILSTCDVILLRQRESERYQQALEQIQDTGRSMKTLITRLLSTAHLSSENRQIENFTELQLEQVAETAVTRMHLLAQQKEIELSFFSLRPTCIYGDAERLEELCLILIENALLYSPAQTQIRVSSTQEHQEAILSVEDQGPGIPVAEIPFLFQRFFRGQISESIPGTGLGLTLAEQIIQVHKGRLTVENRAEGGTCFRCYFPLLESN